MGILSKLARVARHGGAGMKSAAGSMARSNPLDLALSNTAIGGLGGGIMAGEDATLDERLAGAAMGAAGGLGLSGAMLARRGIGGFRRGMRESVDAGRRDAVPGPTSWDNAASINYAPDGLTVSGLREMAIMQGPEVAIAAAQRAGLDPRIIQAALDGMI